MSPEAAALIGAVIGGLFGTAGAVIGSVAAARQQGRALAHERALKDRDELRDLLDRGAVLLLEARWAINEGGFQRDAAIDATVREKAEEARRLEARLLMRLPVTHPLMSSYQTAVAAIGKLESAVNRIEPFAKLGMLERNFNDAEHAYREAVRAVLGADVTPVEPQVASRE